MAFTNKEYSVAGALVELLKPFENSLLTEKEQKAFDELQGLVEPLAFWKDNFPVERVLEVEEPFEFQIGSLTFQGRPDRVAVVFGKAFHIQNKTVSAQTDLGVYYTLAGRSLHELHYGKYLEEKYAEQGLEYGGTIYNVIKKLKYRSKTVSKAEPLGKILNAPETMFSQVMIGLDPNQAEIAKAELEYWVTEMLVTADEYFVGDIIGATRAWDSGYHGHGLDPYTEVMLGEKSLDDDRYFMDREQTYAEVRE
jgi:hypothetical protein